MAQLLILRPPPLTSTGRRPRHCSSHNRSSTTAHHCSWTSVRHSLKCNGRFSCLFSDGRKQEQARKALESALGGKKTEFEKWDKEIKRREEAGGGGGAGGGGWFRWGRWFGDGDHFWQEVQQTSLTILGIFALYLIIAKGETILAVVINPLLFALRGTRNGFALLTSYVPKMVSTRSQSTTDSTAKEEYVQVSAKESVIKKWGSD